MASNGLPPGASLEDVLGQLRAIQQKQDELLSVVDSMAHSSTDPALGTHPPTVAGLQPSPVSSSKDQAELDNEKAAASSAAALAAKPTATPPLRPTDAGSPSTSSPTQSGFTSRIVLT